MNVLTTIMFLLVAATVLIAFVPRFKGARTVIASRLVIVWGAVLPYLSDIMTPLKSADWRAIIGPDYAPLVFLFIGILFELLRRKTTTPVK